MTTQRRIIGVIGSADPSREGLALAREVGREVARAGAVLVTGGLGGVMEAASAGCGQAGGLVVGILPGSEHSAANPHVQIAIPSGMGHARNIIVAQTAQVLIAIEGGLGTLSEIAIGLKTGRRVFLLGAGPQVEGAIRVETPHEAVTAAIEALQEGTHG